jgi:SHS2 domain-containing protein
MEGKAAGYRELEHTADWELEVWAPDFLTLLEQAARGMYALAGMQLKAGVPQVRELEVSEPDRESLLVSFLNELLYLEEAEDLGFDSFDLRLDGEKLRAHLKGAPLASLSKEIKAVTYHHLAVRQTARGLEVNIVFDV